MPKELILPGREAIHQLPRWARIALGIRLMRRVVRRFALFHVDATRRQIELIEQTLDLAETAAKEQFESDHPLVQKLLGEAEACQRLATELIEPSAQSAWIALGVSRVAEATAIACRSNRLAVVDLIVGTLDAALEAGLSSEKVTKDWNKLMRACELNEWDKDSPVPQKLFGPM